MSFHISQIIPQELLLKFLMLRNGGRTGVALNAGFRWTIGKEPKHNINEPVKKKVIKSL